MSSKSTSHEPPVPENRYRRFFWYWLPLVLFCATIFFQSSLPSSFGVPLFPHDDKVMHMGAYAVMAILFSRALKAEKPGISMAVLSGSAIGFASIYGLSDELHQFFVPGRDASFWDVAADILGGFLGAGLYLYVLRSKS